MTLKTGWCLSEGIDQHLNCPETYGSSKIYRCPCYCHGNPEPSKENES